MSETEPQATAEELHDERWELLQQLDEFGEKPLVALAFVWLILLIIDLTNGLNRSLQLLSYAIWGLFVLDFVIEIVIAPDKSRYLRTNWLTAVALLLPALRILRIFRTIRLLRAARTLRSINLVRLVTSLNRGMKAIARTLGGRGFNYVIAATISVIFAGAAGMFFFERSGVAVPEGQGFDSYGDAVWWTGMIMTTLGSEYWPQTAEGRILTWLLSVYALAVFGYITATIASYFLEGTAAVPSTSAETSTGTGEAAALHEEIAGLRQQVSILTAQLEAQAGSGQQKL